MASGPRSAPAPAWLLIALVLAFLLAGTTGHDPWKIEDATHFGVVWRALDSGNWLAFRLSGAAVAEPPLYYWVGALLGEFLPPLLTPPDAIRLASPVFAAIACMLLYVAARELHGPPSAAAAPLALVGSLGFLVQSHETQPMLAVLAAFSATYAGTALAPRRPIPGALLVGCGAGALVLAHGVTLLAALLLTAAFGIVRSRHRGNSTRAVAWGIVLATALAAPWLLSLRHLAPATLEAWWAAELAQLAAAPDWTANTAQLAGLLLWFAWPALPFAAWSLWACRKKLADPEILLPVVATALIFANVALVFEARTVVALALLPALSLLAVPGVLLLRRGAASAFDWFGRMTFGLLGSVVWLGWVAMNFGVPPRIARNFTKLAPGFTASIDPAAVAIAVAFTLAWLWLILVRPPERSPLRPLVNWVGGMALFWVLATALLLPWIEHGKTYRTVAQGIAQKTDGDRGCISTRAVGEGQFASIDYFLGGRLRSTGAGSRSCDWLLIQGTQPERPPGAGWSRVWEGARPGDKSERFRLYRSR